MSENSLQFTKYLKATYDIEQRCTNGPTNCVKTHVYNNLQNMYISHWTKKLLKYTNRSTNCVNTLITIYKIFQGYVSEGTKKLLS